MPVAAGARPPAGHLSVIIPTLNEVDHIGATLDRLEPFRTRGHEVIVVDGGSTDGTRDRVRPRVDRVIAAGPGRARQMNAGADAALGDTLLFLHADTRLPAAADTAVLHGLARSGRKWGRFDVQLSGAHPLFRLGERWISWRSRLTGIATGDQAIFVRRGLFESIGGFPDIPLMEDVSLTGMLRAAGRPLSLRDRVVTSSRRWEEDGILRTALLMVRLRFAFWRGVDPARLAARYGAG